jgi:peptidyl-prolyl cis-trans isomerase D
MFDFVRKHTRIMQFLLFLLIVPSFLLFGIEGYSKFRDKGETVAEVAGQDISQVEWDAAHKQEVERVRSSNPNIDLKLLDSPQARNATLERLVRERVLAVAADKSGLVTADQRLRRALQEDPSIAALRLPDGSLDKERYRQLVASQGLSPEGFEARIRADLSSRQVTAGVLGTGFSPATLADLSINAFLERREIQVARFNAADYAPKVELTDAEIEAYYQANLPLFQSTEQANIEYLVLDLDAVKKSIVLNEADLKTYYEQNQERLSGKEERRASHILIEAPKTAAAEMRQKAKARAQELLALVQKSPESFAELAKKNSQDVGSAANGGDLDFFVRGAMLKPFEDATFALKKGEISAVVETDFGYHIIKLTDVKTPKQRSFEDVRAEIETELKKSQAQRKFAETAEIFTNTVYEQSDSLKPAAERLKLEVRSAPALTRRPAPGVTGVLANPKFLATVFSADSVEKKRNTEAVEIAPNVLASGRIVQYTPTRTLPLAEVKTQVRARLQAARGADLARKDGMAKLTAWQASPEAATLPPAVSVSRDQPQNLPAPVVEAALRADSAALPAFAGVDLGAQGYAVIKVGKMLARTGVTDESAKGERAQYAQAWGNAENAAYYKLLQERYKVKVHAAKAGAKSDADSQVQPAK